MKQQQKTKDNAARPGRRAVYPGKLRDKPLTLALTAEGRAAVVDGAAFEGLSRTDHVERMARAHVSKVRQRVGDDVFNATVKKNRRRR